MAPEETQAWKLATTLRQAVGDLWILEPEDLRQASDLLKELAKIQSARTPDIANASHRLHEQHRNR